MKKIVIFILVIGLVFVAGLTSCGANNNSATNNPSNPTTNQPTDNPSGGGNNDNDEVRIAPYKSAAISKLDEIVNPALEKIANEDLKTAIRNYYNSEKQYINGITNLQTAMDAANKVVEDTKAYVKNTLKSLAIEKLNAVINPLINEITYADLKRSVQSFYDSEIQKMSAVETLDDLATFYNKLIDDTKKFISEETVKIIVALKNAALEELEPYVTALISKIPYDTLKTDTQSFYNTEKGKLEAVNTIDGVSPCVSEIKNDLETYAISETKKIAVSKLEEIIDEGLDKIPNPELKSDLQTFSAVEIAKINAVEKIEDVPTTLQTVITETQAHIKELLASMVKEYLSRLLAVETATAYDYLPTAMSPTYEANVVTPSNINYDFSTFTNVSSINQAGFGEQWQMVIDNINQSVSMARVFNVIQTILNEAGTIVDIYITNSYADEMTYSFNGNGFSGLFEFKDGRLVFNIVTTGDVSVPVFGSARPIIRMEYDLTNNAKGVFISLGDAYKVKYVITDNAYEMAITYGIKIAEHEGSRSSYLSITKDSNNKTTGHIYEYTSLDGSDKIKACADFYVENGFVSVVGNKSSGMVGFSGYINELYLANSGKLLGYEVREELTILGVTGTYNTLWFNLWDIDGINTIKVTDKTDANKSSRSTADVYINGSSELLSPTYNTLLVKTSRKYDIEFRTRYYYTYDSDNATYDVNAINVPMMFIQEGDNYSSFSSDIKKDNNITASVSLNSVYLEKILADYDTLIDVFIRNKDAMSSEQIITYLQRYE